MHRLFIGLPVPNDAATEITDWGCSVLSSKVGRIVSPNMLHLSIAFFAKASAELRDQLTEHVRRMPVSKMEVETDGIWLYRYGALALDINSNLGAPKKIPHLKDYRDFEWRQLLASHQIVSNPNDPLTEIFSTQFDAGTHHERGNRPHITFARIFKEHRQTEFKLDPPVFRFEFKNVCLYESLLGGGGSQYEIIAESALRS